MHFPRNMYAALLLWAAQSTRAITFTMNDTASIKSAASTVAFDMASYYIGNQSGQIPGLLPQPYYWWECGAMFGSLINYWYYTGDSSYNEIVTQGIIFQNGGGDFMPGNQTLDLGNDDQMFWGFAAMSAAEFDFPNPPADGPQWLGLAQGVFNSQAARWDNSTCGGGLHWQIFTENGGYNYKNTPANGGFFNLASRLYAYTGNQTYLDRAETMWDWMYAHGLISPTGAVYDGTTPIPNNCTTVDHDLWTYNAGMMLNGAATLWNTTNSTEWYNRTLGIWQSASVFFRDGVMAELCEPNHCDLNEFSFKAYFSRFIAASTKVAPWLYPLVRPFLETSAVAAALQCNGGTDGTTCGLVWTNNGTYDGNPGVGQQMSVLEVINSLLIQDVSSPVSSTTGGTSKGYPGAGASPGSITTDIPMSDITGGDRAGAGFLTALVLAMALSGTWWIVA